MVALGAAGCREVPDAAGHGRAALPGSPATTVAGVPAGTITVAVMVYLLSAMSVRRADAERLASTPTAAGRVAPPSDQNVLEAR